MALYCPMASEQENLPTAGEELTAAAGSYCQLLQGHRGDWRVLACEWKPSESDCQSWAQSVGADSYVF